VSNLSSRCLKTNTICRNDNESVEHEKQMGDLNRDKEEVVDERMWNSEDEDDENEDGDNQEDTYEKDAPMPTNKKSQTELGAKPEDEKKKPQKVIENKKENHLLTFF